MAPLISGLSTIPPLPAAEAKKHKLTVAITWRMDQTYVKVEGQWVCLCHSVDIFGDTIDFHAFRVP